MIIQVNFPKFLKKNLGNYPRNLEKSICKKLKYRLLEDTSSALPVLIIRAEGLIPAVPLPPRTAVVPRSSNGVTEPHHCSQNYTRMYSFDERFASGLLITTRHVSINSRTNKTYKRAYEHVTTLTHSFIFAKI